MHKSYAFGLPSPAWDINLTCGRLYHFRKAKRERKKAISKKVHHNQLNNRQMQVKDLIAFKPLGRDLCIRKEW